MPTEEKDTMELLDECERSVYEELLKLDVTDPNYEKVQKSAKTFADIKVNYAETEQNRLNSYAKNEQDDRRLVIEEKKVQVDKSRVRMDGVKAGLYFFGGIATGLGGFFLEPIFQKSKTLEKFSEKLIELNSRR